MIYVKIEFIDVHGKISMVDAYRTNFEDIFKFINDREDVCSSDKKIYKVYITNLIKLEETVYEK